MRQSTINMLMFIGIILLIFFALYFSMGPSFYILVVSFVFAYLSLPIVTKLEQKGVRRVFVVVGLMNIFIGILVILGILIIPKVIQQLKVLWAVMPPLAIEALDKVQNFSETFGINISLREIRSYIQKSFMGEATFPVALDSVKEIFGNIVNTVVTLFSVLLIPVFYFYVVEHLDQIKEFFLDLCPRSFRRRFVVLIQNFDKVVNGYIQGQLVISLVQTAVYTVGFSLINLPWGFSLGLVAGVLSSIPYLGASIAIFGGLIIVISHFSFALVLGFAIVIGVAQALESFVLTPRVVGDKVGLSPLGSMISLIIGAKLLGLVGVLIALPVGGIIKIIISEILRAYKKSKFYY